MSKGNNLTDFLVDIADTIRAKKGTTNPINPQDFSTEIGNIADEKHTEGYNEGVNYQKSLLTSLNVTENGTYSNENGYNEVNVNVAGGGKVVLKDGTKLGYSTFTTIPEEYDFSKITDFSYFFSNAKLIEASMDLEFKGDGAQLFINCQSLKKVNLPNFLITNAIQTFYYCSKLTDPYINTQNCYNMTGLFNFCSSLVTIPQYNTAKVTNMSEMFYGCSSLITIPQLNTSNVQNMSYMFRECASLESLPKFDCINVENLYFYFGTTMSNLTTVGGWENLKCNWDDDYGLKVCPNLTYESCINVLNSLYNFTGNGETPTSSQGNLKVHQNFLDLVGDKISIGTNKGWTITS